MNPVSSPNSLPRTQAVRALRVLGMFLIVMAHASFSYQTTSFHSVWPLVDLSTFVGFDYLLPWLGAALPLFFLLAGMSAGLGYGRCGPRAFLTRRIKRLLFLFVLGLLTVGPVTFFVWSWVVRVSGNVGEEMRSQSIGPMHLWFLEYLLLLSVAYGCLRAVAASLPVPLARAWPRAWSGERLWSSSWVPLFLALPTFLILWLDWSSVVRFTNTFVPNPARLAYYGLFFLSGTVFPKGRQAERSLTLYGPVYLALSVPVFLVTSHLLMRRLVEPLDGAPWFLFLVCAALLPWLTLFGLFGVCLRLFEKRSRWLAYLSDASLWVYLSHLPVVILLQLALYACPWPAVVKFLLVVVGTLSLVLLLYQAWVRNTRIGALLTGGRPHPPARGVWRSRLLGLGAGCLLAALVGGTAWYYRTGAVGRVSVVANRVFLTGELSPSELRALISRLRLRTVISLDGDNTPAGEKEVCASHGTALHVLSRDGGCLLSEEELRAITDILTTCQRPVLMHGGAADGGHALRHALAISSGSRPGRDSHSPPVHSP